MADVITSTSTRSDLVIAAYDKFIEFENRHAVAFSPLVDKRPVDVTSPGTTVNFKLHDYLSVNTTPLTETTDVELVGMPAPSTASVTVNEYGNAVMATQKFKGVAYSDVDPVLAFQIATNMRETVDALIVAKAHGVTATTAATSSSTKLVSADIKKGVTTLRNAAAQPFLGEFYACYVHPSVAFDIREDTSDTGWVEAHKGIAPDVFWNGTTGLYGGAFFVETPRVGGTAKVTGTSKAKYDTYLVGRQALVEAVVPGYEPQVVIGPATDHLLRFQPIGWKGLFGFGIYRSSNIVRFETESTFDPAEA